VGSSRTIVAIVASAPSAARALARVAMVSAVMSGTSPLITTMASPGAISPAAARTASPVPRASCWTARVAPSGR
jgi:hypothetical protein